MGNTYTTITGINLSKNWKDPDQNRNPVIFELKKYLKSI
jgi:hypothetical protein